MIRLATLDDIGMLQDMCKSFFDVSGYSEITSFNDGDMRTLLELLIGADCVVTDGKSGVLAFVVFPLFMNNSHLIAQELFWWVDKDKRKSKTGIQLLNFAEAQAKKLGAKQLLMLSLSKLNGDRVNRLYESKGYTPREVTYMRTL